MTTRLIFGRRQATLLLSLLIIGLLAACGGATESASGEATVSPSTAPPADTPTTAPPTEEAAAPDSETTNVETQADSGRPQANISQAMCHTATPQNDPIVGALQPNPAIAQVTDDEWSKGPADAPITLIEYGDFQ